MEEKLKIGYYKSFEDFPLSIPFYSGGRLRGFKLRYISEEAAQKYGNQKYRNTANLNGTIKKEPFGLAPWNVGGKTKGERTLIAVEGDLDALHAIAEGAENITATAGGWITEEMAQAIKAKGYSNVILTLDTDGAGQQFTEKSIEILLNAGINAYVATLPDAKDTEEVIDPTDYVPTEAYVKFMQQIIEAAASSMEYPHASCISVLLIPHTRPAA